MLTLENIKEKMGRLQNWALDGSMIVKDIMFPDFKAAMEFINKVAEIAEKHNHHPYITIDYNHVHLSLITHEINSLGDKDFEVAEEIDKIS